MLHKILYIYLLIVNLIGFSIMFIDKNRAIHKEWRISEKKLFFIAIIGGSIGLYAGMHIFKHKTKHLKFILGIPFIFILQIITAIYFI